MIMVLLTLVALSAVAGGIYRVTGSLRTVRVRQKTHSHRVMSAFSIVMILLPGFAHAHGKVAMEEDPCVQRVGGSLVHFNAYQPQNEAKAQYCTEIPGEGDTFLVVDLVDAGLRHTPVGVRVVRGLSETTEGETVADWPPATHPDGVVRGEARLEKGLYKLIISPEGFSPSSYHLRVQQIDYAKMGRQAMVPLVVFLILALIGYEFSKSKRFMRWRASGNS